jgi:hypothetical protein
MNRKNKYLLLLILILAFTTKVSAQDELLDVLTDSTTARSQPVLATFKTTRIVNVHSVETVKERGLDFRVTHHFGDVAGDGGGVHTLYGMDQSADIRIAFEYGINDRITVGAGRSKIGEMLDGYFKYRLLTQTQDNRKPVSATILANMAYTPAKATTDEYKNAAHRLSYTYQLLVARKFNQKLSVQLTPSFLHRNYLFNPADKHDLFSVGVGGRLKLTQRFALLADYLYTFSDLRQEKGSGYYPPLGLGIEIETGGHVFHMFFTNNAGIIENAFIPNTTASWLKGEFKFGFNISRVFIL